MSALRLDKLNEVQQEAVLADDRRALLVLAGAGTGKTTVITYRIAHFMAERGVSPFRILAMTFTNKAAKEMRQRAADLAGLPPQALAMGTFHGICGRILREFGQHIGLEKNFVIYDADDQLQLVKRCIIDRGLDPKMISPQGVRHHLESWKNQGLLPNEVSDSSFNPIIKHAIKIYPEYRARCLRANAVDFGDMLLHVLCLLRENQHVRETLQKRYSHVLVDEYQDTNPVQYKLLKNLVSQEHSLTVVGDDDQSIYRWRGADIQNILRFEKDFPGAGVIRLEQNYRSTQTILNAANALVANNVGRKGKTLFSVGETGEPISLSIFGTEREEGEAIAARVEEGMKHALALSDVAVLYRTNAQSRAIEDAMRRHRIPYRIFGGMRFYDRKEVKDAMAYLRLVLNPQSDIDFLRVVNEPARGLGKTSAERLTHIALDAQIPLHDAAVLAVQGAGKFQKKARAALKDFVAMLDETRQRAAEGFPLPDLLRFILERSGYLESLEQQDTPEAKDRIENLSELAGAMREHAENVENASLSSFLEDVALASDIDQLNEFSEQISLMTLHAAKGLEFEMVFMPGMEEGLFPHSRSLDEEAALEEERRLCYVGMTRAKRYLCMSSARMRQVFGRQVFSELSRFLSEVPEALVSVAGMGGYQPSWQIGATGPSDDDFSFDTDQGVEHHEPVYERESAKAYCAGSTVHHGTFGQGRILSSSGSGPRQKLVIDFPSAGKKTVVAKFVELVP